VRVMTNLGRLFHLNMGIAREEIKALNPRRGFEKWVPGGEKMRI